MHVYDELTEQVGVGSCLAAVQFCVTTGTDLLILAHTDAMTDRADKNFWELGIPGAKDFP